MLYDKSHDQVWVLMWGHMDRTHPTLQVSECDCWVKCYVSKSRVKAKPPSGDSGQAEGRGGVNPDKRIYVEDELCVNLDKT